MQSCQSAGMLRASAECWLELAAKTLAVRMPQQKLRQRLRVWRYIKRFVGANARIGTRSYVAHRISASLTRGDVRRCQPPHERRSVIYVDVMQLEILARSDVRNPV